jgi:hypothetical protein
MPTGDGHAGSDRGNFGTAKDKVIVQRGIYEGKLLTPMHTVEQRYNCRGAYNEDTFGDTFECIGMPSLDAEDGTAS